MTDANGNLTDLTSTNGSSLAHYEYGPFGQKTASTGSLKEANPWQFSTKYYDEETELNYYGYRYLSTELGRWIKRDSLGEWGGVNIHALAGNSAVTLWDYLGLLIHGQDMRKRCEERNALRDRHDKAVVDGAPIPRLTDKEKADCAAEVKAKLKLPEIAEYFKQFNRDTCPLPEIGCKCCAGSGEHEKVPPPSGKIWICWNNREKPEFDLAKTIMHEGTHALQQCYQKKPDDSCFNILRQEIEAYRCAKQCNSFDSCMKLAVDSACYTKHCIEPDDRERGLLDKYLQMLKLWYERRDKKGMCVFPRNPDYPGPGG